MCKTENFVCIQIFEDNFVHCDLHPGNILVQESPDGEPLESSGTSPRIVILDCGLVTELSESCRRNFRDVFRFVAAGDVRWQHHVIILYTLDEFQLNRFLFLCRRVRGLPI